MNLPGRRIRGLRGWAGFVIVSSVGMPLGAEPQDAAEGKRLFETICVACHTIGAGVKIGPDLNGVTRRRTAEWMRSFITRPESLREAGDSIALANRAKYSIPMPTLGLTAPQVESVIAHLGGAAPSATVRPTLYFPTLAIAVLAAGALTVAALTFGTKRVETRA